MTRSRCRRAGAFAAALALGAGGVAGAGPVDGLIDAQSKRVVVAANSQEKIDALVDETQSLLTEWRAVTEQLEHLRAYNAQLEGLVESQEREMASLEDQIDRVTLVQREVLPLMNRMVDALETFVELDVPFLAEERRLRVEQLREMMGRADVSVSEKYRRVLEAYQIENEYGRTIEAYRGSVETDGRARTVDFLRVGRVALVYQTLDGSDQYVWNRENGSWERLPDRYRRSIREGLRIARKQAPPSLLTLPVAAPASAGEEDDR